MKNVNNLHVSRSTKKPFMVSLPAGPEGTPLVQAGKAQVSLLKSSCAASNQFHFMQTISYLFIIGMVLLFGCSERNNETPIAPTTASIHEKGFTDPASSKFHAKYIQSKNFDLKLCQSCHGANYAGGTTGQSCNTCHNKPSGPENCTTCHGSVNAAPPKDLDNNSSPTLRGVGAHQKHLLGTSLGAAVACNVCHVVPQKVSDVGHIDATNHAEIHFDSTGLFYRSNAVYNASNVSCANTYCHGNMNNGNLNRTMTWTDTSSTATECGTCHGDKTKSTLKEKAFPVSGHTAALVTADCSTCHRAVVNSSMAIIDPSKHMNGRID